MEEVDASGRDVGVGGSWGWARVGAGHERLEKVKRKAGIMKVVEGVHHEWISAGRWRMDERWGLKHWAHRHPFELVSMSCTWVVAGLFFIDMQVRRSIRKVKEYFRTFREGILGNAICLRTCTESI